MLLPLLVWFYYIFPGEELSQISVKLAVLLPLKHNITFGAFAFEFVRRALNEQPIHPYSYWGTLRLGKEFKERFAHYDVSTTNLLLLLHVSISRGRFLESHKYFVDEKTKEAPNYFEYVGNKLAELFLQQLISEPIWVH